MRIAHLSDLHLRQALPGTSHIARRQSRRVPELLRAAVARLEREAPDVVICSGDLLDYPLDRMEDPETLALGQADLALIAGILAPLGCPSIVLPGNHDPLPATRALFCPPEEIVVDGLRFLTFVDREEEANVPHRRAEALERFRAAVAEEASLPQVHVQHYVLWPEPPQSDYPYRYSDADRLAAEAASCAAVRLVLSGHYHPGLAPRQRGGTWFATAPAFCEAPHPLWLYELAGTALRWRSLDTA